MANNQMKANPDEYHLLMDVKILLIVKQNTKFEKLISVKNNTQFTYNNQIKKIIKLVSRKNNTGKNYTISKYFFQKTYKGVFFRSQFFIWKCHGLFMNNVMKRSHQRHIKVTLELFRMIKFILRKFAQKEDQLPIIQGIYKRA